MSREQIKEEFLKSYNCSSMKEFKYTKLTSEKFYEIMEDYFTKCSYNQKYEEVIDKAIAYIQETDCVTWDNSSHEDLLNILKEV